MVIIIKTQTLNNINSDIGARIQSTRKEAQYTQAKFAEKIDVSTQYISDLERGTVGASVQTIIKICDELNISTDYILRGSEPLMYQAPNTLISKISRLSAYQKELAEQGLDLMIKAFQAPK